VAAPEVKEAIYPRLSADLAVPRAGTAADGGFTTAPLAAAAGERTALMIDRELRPPGTELERKMLADGGLAVGDHSVARVGGAAAVTT